MTRLRRFGVRLGLTVLILASLGVAIGFAFVHTFYPDLPKAAYPPPADLADAQRQDFDYFRHYLDLDRSYTPPARERARALLAGYTAQSGTFSPAGFDLAIARMVALADNGHSRVHPGPLSRRHNRLPCHLYRFADGYRVLRARPACADLLGAQVIALDGRPVDEVAERMYEYFGGPRNRYDQFAAVFFLESPVLLHAAGLAHAADRLAVRVLLRDGSEREVQIAADPADAEAPRAYSDQYLSPQRIDKEPADWASLLPVDAALPLFLRDYATPFQSGPLDDAGIYYVQLRSNDDEPGRPIGAFLARVEQEIRARQPRVVVLDLRFDPGGNFTKTASVMKRLPTLTASIVHVYALTSAWTFSAGNVSLALLKAHGGDKVSVIGEPVGDRLRLWAEGGSLVLPNSKLAIRYATGLHDYSRSCFGEPGCFWIMAFYPMQVDSLAPDVRVNYTFDDYMNLRDPMLARALELARAP